MNILPQPCHRMMAAIGCLRIAQNGSVPFSSSCAALDAWWNIGLSIQTLKNVKVVRSLMRV
ncbi:MAG: hypothetical protein R3184_12505, partial [Aurantimonas coralicida]|nr:hypothetical protein [Aurantimonas coralicida]